jgi:hypothetical protein
VRFLPGIAMLVVAYLFLTAYRDFRDNYGVEIFGELGYAGTPAIFTRTEVPVAIGVFLALAALILVRDNRRAMVSAFALMTAGMALLAGGAALWQAGVISGATWMITTGLGSYLAYVPFNAVLFERIIASTRSVGTAVFIITLADAVGYTGSVGMQLYKDLIETEATRLEFFVDLTYVMAAVGGVLFVLSCFYFSRQARVLETNRTKISD